jgi:hypothetical protein
MEAVPVGGQIQPSASALPAVPKRGPQGDAGAEYPDRYQITRDLRYNPQGVLIRTVHRLFEFDPQATTIFDG